METASVIAVFACLLGGVLTGSDDYLLSPLVFDALFYINDNPDIMFADVLTTEKAQLHWLTLGAEEGRQGCGSFHAKQYLNRYTDLQNAFGSNYTQAIQHYVLTGHSENRTGYVEGGFRTPFGTRWTISNGHIFLSASERMGAAIDSLVWRNKQFINAHDHARCLQIKASKQAFGECFAPTECGSRDDSNGARSTTHVISVNAHGHTLETKVFPAFWLRPGTHPTPGHGCHHGNTAINKNTTYNHPFQKKVTLGCAGSVQCVEFTSIFTVDGSWPTGDHHIEFQAPAAFLAGDMTKEWRFTTQGHYFHNHSDTISRNPIAMGTEDGAYVAGIYAPPGQHSAQQEIYTIHNTHQPAENHSFPGSFSMFNVVFTIRQPVHIVTYTFKTYLCFGNLSLVRDCMTKVVRHYPHA